MKVLLKQEREKDMGFGLTPKAPDMKVNFFRILSMEKGRRFIKRGKDTKVFLKKASKQMENSTIKINNYCK